MNFFKTTTVATSLGAMAFGSLLALSPAAVAAPHAAPMSASQATNVDQRNTMGTRVGVQNRTGQPMYALDQYGGKVVEIPAKVEVEFFGDRNASNDIVVGLYWTKEEAYRKLTGEDDGSYKGPTIFADNPYSGNPRLSFDRDWKINHDVWEEVAQSRSLSRGYTVKGDSKRWEDRNGYKWFSLSVTSMTK